MYWPSVSLKKQLELEHVKSTLHHDNIRKSVDQQRLSGAEANAGPKSGSGLRYERPWRKAMAKGGRTLEQGASESSKPRAASEVPGSPQPYENIKRTARSGVTPINVKRYGKNYDLSAQHPTDGRLAAQTSLHSLEKPSALDGLTGAPPSTDPRGPRKQFDYLNEMRQKRLQDELQDLEKSSAGGAELTGRSKPSNNEKYIDKLISNRNLNDYEKIEAVKRKASLLEEKAR